MKQMKWKNILKYTFVTLAAVTAGLLLSFYQPHKVSFAEDKDPRSVNVEFKVGQVERTANRYENGTYTYPQSQQYFSGEVDEPILENQTFMLRNYTAQNNLAGGSGVQQVKNIYVGLGTPYSSAMQEGTNYGDNGLLLKFVSVTAAVNGQIFAINNTVTETSPYMLNGDNTQNYYYWYQYLDLTNLIDQYTAEPITKTEGQYTFTFTYSYLVKNGSYYELAGPFNYNYSFYLINETTYAENYPTIENAVTGNSDSINTEQFFYNFQTASLPTITYDASLYNISYTKVKDNVTETVTTLFTKNPDNSGKIIITSSLNGTKEKNIVNTGGVYLNTCEWEELGTYTIFIRYVVSTPNEYKIISNEEIPAYNITRIDSVTGENPYLQENGLLKSYYKLHIFGIKAYFTKNNASVQLKNGNVFADYTAKVNSVGSVSVTSGLYAQVNDGNFPVTNLPPITFSSFGTYSYDSVNTSQPLSKMYRYAKNPSITEENTPTQSYITKNSQLSTSGYYEVIIAYTYSDYSVGSNDALTTHYQVFVFAINTSTPAVALKTTNDSVANLATDSALNNTLYTNKNVYASFATPTFFQSAVTANLTKRNYDLSGATTTALTLNTIGNNTLTPLTTQNGNYMLRVYYSENINLYVEYNFIIDKNPVSNINIAPINKISTTSTSNDDLYVVKDTSMVNFNNSMLINQPFTLLYSPKQSGASITTTYQKIPFTAYLNGGTSINSSTYTNHIQTNYEINYNSITSSIEYQLDYSVLNTDLLNPNNAFIDNSSFIYLFTITDQAGNISKKYVVYDLTTPQVITTPTIDNPYNIVSSETNVKWGSHKAVKIKNSSPDITNNAFKELVQQQTTLFQFIDGNYYLVVPLTTVTFTNNSTQTNYTFSTSSGNWQNSVTIQPVVNNTSQFTQFFSGEKSYSYKVTDASNINSTTNIAKNNSYNNNIWMNLDNSVALLYGKHNGATYPTGQATEYGEALDWNKTETNANQLRLTYKPGEEGTDYEVKSFTYHYYEFATSNYTNLASGTYSTHTPELNEPVSSYPFNSTPTIINRAITLSTLQIPGQTEGSNLRVVSEVINPVNDGNSITTKTGLYVFRREYYATESGDYDLDQIVRFYAFIVDREKIIQISGDANDVDLNTLTNPTSDSILYNTGSGIGFRFTNSITDTTRYSAKQIQQYIQYTGTRMLFQSNKLPVRLVLPDDKYNTQFTLKKASDAGSYSNYINQVVGSGRFALDFKITYGDQNRIIADTIQKNINGNNAYDLNYFTISTENGVKTLNFKLAGDYNITLYSTKSAEVTTNHHPYTEYQFEFTIVHESPIGNYYSKYNDGSEMLLTQKTTSTNLTSFYSTNKNDLKFVFTDNVDSYKARIDANNLTVTRINKSGVSSTIFTRVNGNSSVQNVFSVATDPVSGLNTYTLNLNSFINQTGFNDHATYKVMLNFMGTEADYTIVNGSTTTNYYRREFSVIVDRIKPQYNYQQLLNSDAQKYNATSVTGLNMNNYFFAINKDFNFIRDASLGSELDSFELFVRPLQATSTELPNYYYTITPDDANYANSSVLSNNPRFSESNLEYGAKYTYDTAENGAYVKNAADMIEHLISQYNTNYFEIIERDEAGNYKVYAVQYTNTKITPTVSLQHKQIGQESFTPATLTDQTPNLTLHGNSLQFTEIQSSDLFLKAIVSYNGNNNIVVNNPNVNTPSSNFNNFTTALNSALAFTKTNSATGYSITITFVNRYSDNYVLSYLIPGDRLQPIFVNISSSQFRVTIPANTTSTWIEQFRVWKFDNGAWSTTDLGRDALGTPIRKGEPGGDSLQNQTYVFGVGEYKFQLIDNFGRGENQELYPAFYWGVGVNNVNQITYRSSEVVDGITYTANTVTLSYQTNLYELKLYKYVVIDEVETKVLITSLTQESNIKVELNNTTNVRTLNFSLLTHGSQQRYTAELVFHRIANYNTVYDFMLYKKLPNITLRTLSGSYLNPNSSPFTENFLVTWSNDVYDFKPTVNLIRSYTGSDNKIKTETISNITNGYQVNLIGNYTAIITNSLGYTHSSHNLTFQLVTGSVVVYEVLAINNGIETVVNPSPITSTINIEGMEKVLYKYYTLEKYNGTVLNHEVQVRVNTNKALEVEDLTEELGITGSKVYRVFGSGEYGYERYIQVVFVTESPTNENFTNLSISQPTYNEETKEYDVTNVTIAPVMKNTAQYLNIKWNSYNVAYSGTVEEVGNIIYADYYYNNQFVKTIFSYNTTQNEMKITTAGIHKFVFRDLAGNQQTFNGYSNLTINFINNVTFLVNGEEPLNNLIVNNLLSLEITNRSLYDSDPVVTAKHNGETITVNRVGTSGYVYEFKTQGYYEVTMSVIVRLNGTDQTITTTYYFVIINAEQKLIAFDLPQNYGFTIENLVYEGSDITYSLNNLNELWLSPASTGQGQYNITLRAYVAALETYKTFQFSVIIYDDIPEITASIDFGTNTTKNIDVFYNPFKIYDSLGEAILRVRSGNYTYTEILISSADPNSKQTLTISENGTFFVEVLTRDGKLITSYKLIKDEPLNTTSIIVIIVASVLVGGLIIVFIILRSRIKFR